MGADSLHKHVQSLQTHAECQDHQRRIAVLVLAPPHSSQAAAWSASLLHHNSSHWCSYTEQRDHRDGVICMCSCQRFCHIFTYSLAWTGWNIIITSTWELGHMSPSCKEKSSKSMPPEVAWIKTCYSSKCSTIPDMISNPNRISAIPATKQSQSPS